MRNIIIIISVIAIATLSSGFGCGKDAGSYSSSPSGGTSGTGKAGSLARFAVVGNYLYALDGKDIVTYDITNATSPIVKSHVKVSFDIETIYPYQGNLFIGAATGMHAYSLADPAKPQYLSVVRHVRACDPVVVQGSYAYVTLRSGTNCGGTDVMNVYNVSNLSNPQLVKTINLLQPQGLGISGQALYVTTPAGIKMFNLSQPANPSYITDIQELNAADVIPYNNTLIVQLGRGAAFYDISNELAPSFLSRITQ